ncbi:hypothetical protein COCSUDRAFT_64027 [Coccomyxa subellipsoidea C-169]|uniref:Uncharacterized protein n=1 Tax=Coccomyxa subellipsoidea (strain C-169) TaxID=574566 RepID=I0YWY8_COCSC|nr:hypothetical protein COCSUDRAFT_64027 [Coccomyxa subellipsoidea C-169]EIE22907.1 hypothetical protein COCSUDRAFT_64027 [Coccomyxa subellipsoidea C-169]|eukprot:XP_005647451.1 hypothetical protein COCSUDRAFT_64027 [Coccomyxa subellipsoidea C-169]
MCENGFCIYSFIVLFAAAALYQNQKDSWSLFSFEVPKILPTTTNGTQQQTDIFLYDGQNLALAVETLDGTELPGLFKLANVPGQPGQRHLVPMDEDASNTNITSPNLQASNLSGPLQPTEGNTQSVPDTLGLLGARGKAEHIWEVSMGHYSSQNVSEAAVTQLATRVYKEHADEFSDGISNFAEECAKTLSHNVTKAAELFWGWKVAIGIGELALKLPVNQQQQHLSLLLTSICSGAVGNCVILPTRPPGVSLTPT